MVSAFDMLLLSVDQ